MKEQDLIDLGFQKEEVDDTIAGGYGYYNYAYYFKSNKKCTQSLITPANDEVEDDEWYAEFIGCNSIRFYSYGDLKLLIDTMESNVAQ